MKDDLLSDEINSILEQSGDSKKRLVESLEDLYSKKASPYSVLGVDIYQYSAMENSTQLVVPFILEQLLSSTFLYLETHESFFFSKKDVEAMKKFLVHTGDGFFVTVENPLKGFVFLIALAQITEIFRIGRNAKTLSEVIESITFRYALSTGDLYFYKGKCYGDAIIKCARIIALDKLNRFLLDGKSVQWFNLAGDGLETLRLHGQPSLSQYGFNTTYKGGNSSFFFPSGKPANVIMTLISQKIGETMSKKTPVDIFSVYVQSESTIDYNDSVFSLVASIGNLNVGGIVTESS